MSDTFHGRSPESQIEEIRELRAARDEAYTYAATLADSLWGQHYKDAAPDWAALKTVIGVLTQIDNMVAGMTKP